MKKEIQLPKLPYGQGNYSWKDASHTRIKFRKRINGENKSVTGVTVQECNRKMKELEIRLETEKKESWKQNPNNAALTLVQSAKAWMETFKLTTLKGKSYDTLQRARKHTRISGFTSVHNIIHCIKKRNYQKQFRVLFLKYLPVRVVVDVALVKSK